MKIIDISWPLSSDTTAYKNRKVITFTHVKSFEQDNVRESTLLLGSHSGTHIDAPSHFLADGESIEKTSLEALCGPCIVVDCSDVPSAITAERIAQYSFQKQCRVLFKTRNSLIDPYAPFDASFVYLDATAAQLLVEREVAAVGIDYLGIERNQPLHETHTVLMNHTIAIIEGLRLAHVESGSYTLWCLPLAIHGLEAAPARAVLTHSL